MIVPVHAGKPQPGVRRPAEAPDALNEQLLSPDADAATRYSCPR
jgi:hypothetical protein